MTGRRAGRRALRSAAEWRLLSMLLERPRPGWHEELLAVGREVGDRRLNAAATLAQQAREGEYLAVLGPGGALSPREVAYCGKQDPGWVLADLAGFYQAFAFRPAAEDPLDHVAVEVGFVGYLFLKEGFARAAGDADAAAITGRARRAFVSRHLAAIAAPLAQRLQTAGSSYLAAAAQLLAARTPAPPPQASLAELPDEAHACGTCAALDTSAAE